MSKLTASILAVLAALTASAGETAVIKVDGQPLVTYQALPMTNPKGNENDPPSRFKGSNFIHPLKTPSGFTVTCSQPADHLHHFGLWWPWKHVQDGQRVVNCWELQGGEGIVQGKSFKLHDNRITADIDYIDRQAPGGPALLLKEMTDISALPASPYTTNGYNLDLLIRQKTAGNRPIVIPVYRYSGFSIRATEFWDKTNSTILTSEGKDRYAANFSHARWVLVQGKTDTGGKAGILLMSHPSNQAHPEMLRTWDEQHNGAVFVNFNTVGDEPWTYLPGQVYSRCYRVFVFDGALAADEAEHLWQGFAKRSTP